MQLRQLSILGLGLMGGSVAAAARSTLKSVKITGYDKSRASVRRAARRGWVDRIASNPVDAIAATDLILLAAPVDAAGALLTSISSRLPPHAVVTDLCSTKVSIVAIAERTLHNPGRFVGGHPVTGKALSGIEHADPSIFRKSLCILTPTNTTLPDTIASVRQFWRSLGMKVVQMTPHEHDRRLALSSHLTQAVASALMATQTLESIAVAGPGLVDTTRLAGADPTLWTGILLDNRPAVLEALDRFSGRLTALRRAIARGDASAVARLIRAGSSRRSRLLALRNGNNR